MRISVRTDDPVAVHERVAGRGHYATIYLDGVKLESGVVTADDERGFVDVYEPHTTRPYSGRLHRLWGKVEIKFGNYLEESKR